MPETNYRLYAEGDCAADGYPPIWHERLKHDIREQAGNRCVRCGHPYVKGAGEWSRCDESCMHVGPYRYEWNGIWEDVAAGDGVPAGALVARVVPREVQAPWRILTVHHLDGQKANCRWWNLAALCQRCHLEIQGKVIMERRWLREHSDWFKPYVAGYYALCYLGEEIDREEAESRLEELLALEHRQQELAL